MICHQNMLALHLLLAAFPTALKIIYTQEGAPENKTAEQVEEILRKSFSIIEGIADIKFEYLGCSANPEEDGANLIAVVGWITGDETALTFAAPRATQDPDAISLRGWVAYTHGSIVYNPIYELPKVSTTVHELMHDLGLGHSNDPVSSMRPFESRWNLPTQDDIDVLQAMYGPPDVLNILRYSINLETTTATDTFAVNIANSQIFLGNDPADGLSPHTAIQRLTAEAPYTSYLHLSLAHAGTTSVPAVSIYLTDPNGRASVRNSEELGLSNSSGFLFVELASNLATITGDWTITIGNAGRQLGVFTLPVDPIPDSDNKTPMAALTKTRIGNNQFTLAVSAPDPEGDAISYRWYVTGQDELIDAASSLNLMAQDSRPIQAIVGIKDAGIKRTNDQPEDVGFGVLFSRYIVTPAAENTATFFPTEKLPHILSLDAGGVLVSANFKFTVLP
ncbi:MAG: matrixin family metalloprotease [Pseudohongiellaceae bacterium]